MTNPTSQLVLEPTKLMTSTTSPSTYEPMGSVTHSSLYVGDLDGNVDEGRLFDLFNEVGRVHSVRVCRDQENGFSLGYGYVNFTNSHDAHIALRTLNFRKLNGKQIRIMFSDRDPTMRKSGIGNLYIKNLDSSIDNMALYNLFSRFGKVCTCKVAVDSNGQSRGFGFVQFENEEDADVAIKRSNGMLIGGKQVYVGKFIRQEERNKENKFQNFTNVYVKNFPETTTEEGLVQAFRRFGSITSAVVMRDACGKSKCFGFVNFREPEAAMEAIKQLNDEGIFWYVGKAQKKSDRIMELKAKFDHDLKILYEQTKDANLYMKNLDETITDDEKLKALFSEFGTITSCKVMVDSRGLSKGFGFVSFSTREEAKKAMIEMNRKMVGRKPLYVSLAERKEERRARLQAQFSQLRASSLVTYVHTSSIGTHQGAPRLLSPPGYGLTQQPITARAGPSNFMAPITIGSPQAMPQQLMSNGPNQGMLYMFNHGQNFTGHPIDQDLNGNNMLEFPFDVSIAESSSFSDFLLSRLIETEFASVLASTDPKNQRQILGELLYPLVKQIENENAIRVTSILLEMAEAEVLSLIESPDYLKNKIGEAMDMIISASSSVVNIGDHFAH